MPDSSNRSPSPNAMSTGFGWGLLDVVTKSAGDKWNALEQSLDEAVGNTPIKEEAPPTTTSSPSSSETPSSPTTISNQSVGTERTNASGTTDGWSTWSPSATNARPTPTKTTKTTTTSRLDSTPSGKIPAATTSKAGTNSTTSTVSTTSTKKNSSDPVALKAKLRQAVTKLRESRTAQKQSIEKIHGLETKLDEQRLSWKKQGAKAEDELQLLRKQLTEAQEAAAAAATATATATAEQMAVEKTKETEKEVEKEVKKDMSIDAISPLQQTQSLETTSKEVESLKLLVDSLQVTATQRKSELAALTCQVENINEERDEFELLSKRRTSQLESLQEQFALQHETENEMSLQVETLLEENSRVSMNTSSVELRVEEIQKELENKTTSLTKLLASEVDSLKKIKKMKQENAALCMKSTKLEDKNMAIMEEGVGWSKESAKQKKIIQMLRQKLEEYEVEEEETEGQREAMETNLKSVQKRLEVERKGHEEKKKLNEELKREAEKEKKMTLEIMAELEKATSSAEELEASLLSSKKICEERGQKVALMREKMKDFHGEKKNAEKSLERVGRLEREIETSRTSLTEARRETSLTEERLEKEMKSMHGKWQQAEKRSEQMTEQISSSTRPLLRQIAALQTLLEEQRESWSSSERTLTERAVVAETETARASERYKTASAECHAANLNVARLEEKVKSQMVAAENFQRKNEEEEKKNILNVKKLKNNSEARHALLMEKITTAEKEHGQVLEAQRVLSTTLKQEQDKLFRITTMLQLEKERGVKMKERLQKFQSNRERVERDGGGDDENENENDDDGGIGHGTTSFSFSSKEYGSGRGGGGEDGDKSTAATLMAETLMRGGRDAVHKKDIPPSPSSTSSFEGITKMNGVRYASAQNKFLEMRCTEAEKSRDAMTTKLVTMGSQLTKMQSVHAELETLQQKHTTLEKKQNILLEILGEKTEEVEGLNADIGEMKRMYRQQTETLLAQLAGDNSSSSTNLT